MRIRTICSRERAPKRLQCACIFDAPQKNITNQRKPKNKKTKTLTNLKIPKFGPCKNKCSRIINLRVVLLFGSALIVWDVKYVKEQEQHNNCNVYVFLMLYKKMQNQENKKHIFWKTKIRQKHQYIKTNT